MSWWLRYGYRRMVVLGDEVGAINGEGDGCRLLDSLAMLPEYRLKRGHSEK